MTCTLCHNSQLINMNFPGGHEHTMIYAQRWMTVNISIYRWTLPLTNQSQEYSA